MSFSVCQGLQACLEPLMIQPRTSSTDLFHGHKNRESTAPNSDFIQALTNNTKQAFDNHGKAAYVHPPTKPVLDQRSLEMCTESLGSETGTKIDDEVMAFLSLKSSSRSTTTTTTEKKAIFSKEPEIGAGTKKKEKKMRCCSNTSFPPPLSSISSSDCVQIISPHRVGGRLVIEAVTVSTTCHKTYFHAERGDGRLRLRLLNACSDQNSDHEDDEVFEEVEDYEGGEGGSCYDDENSSDEEDDSGNCVYMFEDLEGESGNFEVEIEAEKLERPTRCLESGGYGGNNTVLLNCETLWIAT